MKLGDGVTTVTGGGRVIGKVIALAFAQKEAQPVLAARTLRELQGGALKERALDRRALAIRMDVSQRDEVEAMVASALAEFGRIDILVNDAAVQLFPHRKVGQLPNSRLIHRYAFLFGNHRGIGEEERDAIVIYFREFVRQKDSE